MTKKLLIIVFIQALLAAVSAILFSKMSFIGSVGIRFFYRQYQILKDPVKTALLIFAIQLAVLLILYLIKKTTSQKLSVFLILLFIAIGIGGTYYTYVDFNLTSHRHMKIYFHMGGYLFWVGWFVSCFTLLFSRKNKQTEPLATI